VRTVTNGTVIVEAMEKLLIKSLGENIIRENDRR
jgi:hypothetical protein